MKIRRGGYEISKDQKESWKHYHICDKDHSCNYHVFPIIWIFSGGFKTLTEFTTSCNFIPKNFTLENYAYIFLHSNLLLYVRNTVLLMLGTTAGTLISSSLVAYPLARMDFKGKKVIFQSLLPR